jgi:hypothetical protein
MRNMTAFNAKSVLATVQPKLPTPANDNLDPKRRVPLIEPTMAAVASVLATAVGGDGLGSNMAGSDAVI